MTKLGTFRIPDEFPSMISVIIADLRNIIDQLDSNFKSTKELIIELGRKLDEEKISERSKISRLIKYILKDKIREGKITAKWIEDCLPEDYKRKYSKSEENSHLKKAKKLQKILINNRGKVHAELISLDGSGKETQQKDEAKDECLEGCPRCLELEQALSKTSQIQIAEDLAKKELVILVPKDKYEQLNSVMAESSESFHIVIDKTTWSFVSAELDEAI